jgi:gamma-glutamylcyclotransferase (GGCT)/AIG2-like uncharacterized protein YtfP
MIKYFAYGSNLNLERLKSRGVTVYNSEQGILEDWRLVFNLIDETLVGAGFANIEPCKGCKVEGLIYSISDSSIANLDKFEDHPRDYMKDYVDVIDCNGEKIKCLAYIAQKNRIQPSLTPTEEYLNHILKGQKWFSEAYYQNLLKVKKSL